MKGISDKPFPHIPKCDEGNIPEEQTTFWIMPVAGMDSAEIENWFARSEVVKGGKTEYNVAIRTSAYLQLLHKCIHKVDNFHFGDKFPELMAKGYMDIEPHDVALKKYCFESLTGNDMAELVEIAMAGMSLTSVEKKTRDPDVLPTVEAGQLGSSKQELHVPELSGKKLDKKAK